MTATEQLKNEHRAIEVMLEVLEAICTRLEQGQQVDPQHLKQILEFIRVFCDSCHHHKEENLLFPNLEAAGIPREDGPIGMMLMEHDQGREYVRNFTEAIADYKVGDLQATEGIVENAQGYINLLRQHIDKEDNILYMMADMHLTEKQQRDLLKGFEKIEAEKIGPGKHEEFHQLLDNLKKIYLN